MMTRLWVYDGAMDAGGTTLTLDSEAPGMTGAGKMARFRDVIEFKSDDHRRLTSHKQGNDGTWQTVMRANYQRKNQAYKMATGRF